MAPNPCASSAWTRPRLSMKKGRSGSKWIQKLGLLKKDCCKCLISVVFFFFNFFIGEII